MPISAIPVAALRRKSCSRQSGKGLPLSVTLVSSLSLHFDQPEKPLPPIPKT
jgi:hypothetical protein